MTFARKKIAGFAAVAVAAALVLSGLSLIHI